ncbi:pyridoxamine 5'-phosphate oxidase family protein [Pedobacter alpinus]|uniref:Pyridoxamine 5'-phosphate oxidase family protein n=1 Tax=Pedobacter alpinus TaxID=1590643 RepID=A0ABW5TVI5_9SPHI
MENLNKKDCIALLNNNYIGHLAYISNNKPYTIPITYFFDQKESILAYSSEGHKIEAMRKNGAVSLQVAEINNVKNWHSVLVHGQFEEIEGTDAKFLLHEFAEGVKNIINKKEKINHQFISDFTGDVYENGLTVVYRIKISEIEGKKMS